MAMKLSIGEFHTVLCALRAIGSTVEGSGLMMHGSQLTSMALLQLERSWRANI